MENVDIWFLFACAFLVLAIWPFGPYQASLFLAAKFWRFEKVPKPAPQTASETFAICMCAYNERACIEAKLENLFALRRACGGELDILVYVDGASDGTADILQRYLGQIRLHLSDQRRGKTYGMNVLAGQTDASILVFTDANVLIDIDAIEVLRHYFADPSIGCICSDLTYTNAEDGATAGVGSLFWRFNEWSKSLETKTGSVVGADGALFALRRHLHKPVPQGLIDDIVVSFEVLFQGFRVIRAPELKAFEAHTTKAEDEFHRKARIACECMHVHFHSWRKWRTQSVWNVYKYVAHRLLRWTGGFALLLSTMCTLTGLVAAFGMELVATACIALSLSFSLALVAKVEPALKIWNILLAFAGVSLGVWRALRGERAVIWNVASSSRETAVVVPGRQG